MQSRIAQFSDLEIVRRIVETTINAVYPDYYPRDVVQFFLDHHSRENILADITAGCVYLFEEDFIAVGTGTIHGNEITRVFVLPERQGRGYGATIMNLLEGIVFSKHRSVSLDSSLPAFGMYLKRGYKAGDWRKLTTSSGQVLCYHEMEKRKPDSGVAVNYDGKVFSAVSNTENGEASSETLFRYHQEGSIVYAEYSGGEIARGFLVGTCDQEGNLDFVYQHINRDLLVRTGKCRSVPEFMADIRIRLHENWQWTNGDQSSGSSIIEEVTQHEQ